MRSVCVLLICSTVLLAAPAGAAMPEAVGVAGAKVAPLTATWEFSLDGRTFAVERPAEVPGKSAPLVARATFTVDDPAAVACLWLVHDVPPQPGPDIQYVASEGFCLGSPDDARRRSCGATPLWTHTKITLNGKPVQGPLEPMVYEYVPIEPGGLLVKGTNTLTVSGVLWSLASPAKVPTKPLRLVAAAPQPPVIRSGPVLGMFGANFFSVTCRTNIPAAVSVTAVPGEPPGEKTSALSPAGLYHAIKIPLPPRTCKFKYTVTATVGAMASSQGPFEVRLPALDAKSFRFIAMGNTRCHIYTRDNGPKLAAAILKAQPDLFIHAGQVVELATWDFHWDPFFFKQYGPLLATLPTYLAPDGGDHIGMTFKTFASLAGDNETFNWTQAFGNVRLVGLDGIYDWSPGSENVKWLEGVLKGSKEKFVFVFNHFPGYTDGYNSSGPMRKWKPLVECREVILPLLAKYRATAMISALDFNYERVEPSADKGVPIIIVGGGGAKILCQGEGHEFSKTLVFVKAHAYAVFDIEGDTCRMRAIDIEGKQIDQRTFKPRK